MDRRTGTALARGGAAARRIRPAELLDTFVIRPAAIGFAVWLLGPALGILAGKLLADVAFYVLAIATHEHLRRKGVAD